MRQSELGKAAAIPTTSCNAWLLSFFFHFSEATKRPGRDSPPTPPAPLENAAFQAALQRELPHLKLATDGPTRVHHAHGHTCQVPSPAANVCMYVCVFVC